MPSAQRVFSVPSAPECGEKRQSLDLAESSCQLALYQVGPQSFECALWGWLGRVGEVLAVNKPPPSPPGAATPAEETRQLTRQLVRVMEPYCFHFLPLLWSWFCWWPDFYILCRGNHIPDSVIPKNETPAKGLLDSSKFRTRLTTKPKLLGSDHSPSGTAPAHGSHLTS